jgi:hypothetical protein
MQVVVVCLQALIRNKYRRKACKYSATNAWYYAGTRTVQPHNRFQATWLDGLTEYSQKCNNTLLKEYR